MDKPSYEELKTVILGLVANNYFDGRNQEYACIVCDMGGSGRSHRDDKHDDDCDIAQAADVAKRL